MARYKCQPKPLAGLPAKIMVMNMIELTLKLKISYQQAEQLVSPLAHADPRLVVPASERGRPSPRR
jgi:hypothetical protein